MFALRKNPDNARPRTQPPPDGAAGVHAVARPKARRRPARKVQGTVPQQTAAHGAAAEDGVAQDRVGQAETEVPEDKTRADEVPEAPLVGDEAPRPDTTSEATIREGVPSQSGPARHVPNHERSDGPPVHGAGAPRFEPAAAGTSPSAPFAPVATSPTEESIYAKLARADALVASGIMTAAEARVVQSGLKITLNGIQRSQGQRAETPDQQALAEACVQHPELTELLARHLSDEQIDWVLRNHAQGPVAGEALAGDDRAADDDRVAGNGRAAGAHPSESHGRQDGG